MKSTAFAGNWTTHFGSHATKGPRRNKAQPLSHGRSATNSADLMIKTPINDSNKNAKNRNSSTRCADRKFMTTPAMRPQAGCPRFC
jgi:hypothetical protein